MLIGYHGLFHHALQEALYDRHAAIKMEPFRHLEATGRLGELSILVTRSELRIDSHLLSRLPALRIIIKAGSGTDNICMRSAVDRGIQVLATGGAERSVAELVFALAFACLRHIPIHNRALRKNSWTSKQLYIGRSLWGLHLGIIGFGKIGRETAKLAKGLGLIVSIYDRTPFKPEKVELCKALDVRVATSLPELASWADIVTIHVPSETGGRPLIDGRFLGCMRRGSILINTGRAHHVDKRALLSALRSNLVAAAGLDVHFSEGTADDMDLICLDNVVSTPHIGAQTDEAHEEVAKRIFSVVDDFLTREKVTKDGDCSFSR